MTEKLTENKLRKIIEEEVRAHLQEKGPESNMQGVNPGDIREGLSLLKHMTSVLEQISAGIDFLNAATLGGGDIPVSSAVGQRSIARIRKQRDTGPVHGPGGTSPQEK